MTDRDYGAGRYGERDEDGDHYRPRQRQAGGYRRAADDDNDDMREERAFGGYPDYRSDRYGRSDQGYGRYGQRGQNYGRERNEPYRYQGSRNAYPQEERGDDWQRRSPSAPDYRMSGGHGWQGQHHGGIGGTSEYGQFGQGQYAGGSQYSQDDRQYGQGARNRQFEQGYGQYGEYGQSGRYSASSQSPYGENDAGAYGRSQGAQGDYFDPDYSEWRQNEMQTLDNDYRAYRQERQKKYAKRTQARCRASKLARVCRRKTC